MENWDEAKLEDVVNQKHGEDNIKKTNTTQIVSYILNSNNKLFLNIFFFSKRYANISLKQLITKHTVGFGAVQMAINVCISMHYHQVLHSKVK